MTHRQPLPGDMFDELCPSSLLPFRFGDKWAALVIRCLEDGPRRFSELRVPLHRVTPKVLTQSLRGLERDGLISRTAHPGPQPRVEYALTALGRSMLEPLEAACMWAAEHWDELLDAREQHTTPLDKIKIILPNDFGILSPRPALASASWRSGGLTPRRQVTVIRSVHGGPVAGVRLAACRRR